MKLRDSHQLVRKAREVSSVLRGLSHPVRLRILCRLCEGEATVQELQEACGLAQAPTSQFLARLRAEGRVVGERRGNQVFYSLTDERLVELMHTLVRLYCNPKKEGAFK